jgi:hypothetical protein
MPDQVNDLGSQQSQSINKLGAIVVEDRSVAGEEPHFFASFEGECPVPIEFEFVEPIADREILDSERFHWFNEVVRRRSALLHELCGSRITLICDRAAQEGIDRRGLERG